jgi:hypothetical protein
MILHLPHSLDIHLTHEQTRLPPPPPWVIRVRIAKGGGCQLPWLGSCPNPEAVAQEVTYNNMIYHHQPCHELWVPPLELRLTKLADHPPIRVLNSP